MADVDGLHLWTVTVKDVFNSTNLFITTARRSPVLAINKAVAVMKDRNLAGLIEKVEWEGTIDA